LTTRELGNRASDIHTLSYASDHLPDDTIDWGNDAELRIVTSCLFERYLSIFLGCYELCDSSIREGTSVLVTTICLLERELGVADSISESESSILIGDTQI
jgi:hypothetical protein